MSTDSLGKGVENRISSCLKTDPPNSFYRSLYPKIIQDKQTTESNWWCGQHNLQRIQCHSEDSEGFYYLQYDVEKIIIGLQDKIWDKTSLGCLKVLIEDTGSILSPV